MQHVIISSSKIIPLVFAAIVFLIAMLLVSIPETRAYDTTLGYVPFWLLLLPSISIGTWLLLRRRQWQAYMYKKS